LLLALIPLSALFSAVSLAIAAFAKSSKEGQYYLMPVLMITLPLMMLPMMPTTELDLGMSLIPVAGVMLLLQTLIEGQYLEAVRFIVPVMGVTLLCCLLAMRWAIDQFNKESVLFRESEQWGLGIWLRSLVRDRRATPSLSAAVLCGVLLLLIRFFASFMFAMPETWESFAAMTVISLVAFIAVPAILMTVFLTRSPAQTLLLPLPRFEMVGMNLGVSLRRWAWKLICSARFDAIAIRATQGI
ncbi:MAG: CPBP family intramembrane metalloprotease, partial [Planctomycetia bacterium]|nr:CPBP family intramembrane metalloprotease [Planctomycetia bacterium]